MEGYLKQQCLDDQGIYEWKRKHFSLNTEKHILVSTEIEELGAHFKGPKPPANHDCSQSGDGGCVEEIARIPLAGSKEAKEWSFSSAIAGYGFDLVWTSGQCWSFLVDDEKSCMNWVQSLNKSISIYNEGAARTVEQPLTSSTNISAQDGKSHDRKEERDSEAYAKYYRNFDHHQPETHRAVASAHDHAKRDMLSAKTDGSAVDRANLRREGSQKEQKNQECSTSSPPRTVLVRNQDRKFTTRLPDSREIGGITPGDILKMVEHARMMAAFPISSPSAASFTASVGRYNNSQLQPAAAVYDHGFRGSMIDEYTAGNLPNDQEILPQMNNKMENPSEADPGMSKFPAMQYEATARKVPFAEREGGAGLSSFHPFAADGTWNESPHRTEVEQKVQPSIVASALSSAQYASTVHGSSPSFSDSEIGNNKNNSTNTPTSDNNNQRAGAEATNTSAWRSASVAGDAHRNPLASHSSPHEGAVEAAIAAVGDQSIPAETRLSTLQHALMRQARDAKIAEESVHQLQQELQERTRSFQQQLEKAWGREQKLFEESSREVELRVLRASNENQGFHDASLKAVHAQHASEVRCLREDLAEERKRYSDLLLRETNAKSKFDSDAAAIRNQLLEQQDQVTSLQIELARQKELAHANQAAKERELRRLAGDFESKLRILEREKEHILEEKEEEIRRKIQDLNEQFTKSVHSAKDAEIETVRQQLEGEKIRACIELQKKCNRDVEQARTEERRVASVEFEKMRDSYVQREQQTAADLIELENLHEHRVRQMEEQLSSLRKTNATLEARAIEARQRAQRSEQEVAEKAAFFKQQMEKHAAMGAELNKRLADAHDALQESRDKEAGMQGVLKKTLTDLKVAQAALFEARRQATQGTAQLQQWEKYSDENRLSISAAHTAAQIARDEVTMLEHELGRLKRENADLRENLKRADRIVYGVPQHRPHERTVLTEIVGNVTAANTDVNYGNHATDVGKAGPGVSFGGSGTKSRKNIENRGGTVELGGKIGNFAPRNGSKRDAVAKSKKSLSGEAKRTPLSSTTTTKTATTTRSGLLKKHVSATQQESQGRGQNRGREAQPGRTSSQQSVSSTNVGVTRSAAIHDQQIHHQQQHQQHHQQQQHQQLLDKHSLNGAESGHVHTPLHHRYPHSAFLGVGSGFFATGIETPIATYQPPPMRELADFNRTFTDW